MNHQNLQSRVIFGLILIGLGVLFAASQLINFQIGDHLWPLAIIGGGGLFFVAMVAGGSAGGGWAVPGSMTVMTGVILLYQNTFQAYQTWSYCWALLVAAFGVGMVIRGYWDGLVDLRRKGWALAGQGMIMFLVFGSFFELFIYRHTLAAGILWPLALILVGGYLLASRFFTKPPTQHI